MPLPPPPVNLMQLIDSVKHLLQPPVCNTCIYRDQFWLMIIGGPNNRKDFHEQDGEEWFYMVKGDMNLKVFVDGCVQNIPIKEGEMFMLPAHTPHSPQRFADTVGIVMERKRLPGETDHLRWYCDQCCAVVYEESFFCTDLGSQLKPVIERYVSTASLRVCQACGHENTPFSAQALPPPPQSDS